MDPAQAMLADIELPGIVAGPRAGGDDALAQKAMGLDAAPQRAFGGDEHRVRIDPRLRGGRLFRAAMPSLSRCAFQAA